jgi:glucosylceramidase
VLSEAQRTTVLRALFSDDGLRYGLNRMPIGSSDFAVQKTHIFCAIYTERRSFYQDRLGTNIGKALKRDTRFSQDNYYSLDDSPGDYSMANLSLARDRTKLLPYIKAAMEVRPKLKVWGSPWTAPGAFPEILSCTIFIAFVPSLSW